MTNTKSCVGAQDPGSRIQVLGSEGIQDEGIMRFHTSRKKRVTLDGSRTAEWRPTRTPETRGEEEKLHTVQVGRVVNQQSSAAVNYGPE